MGAILWPVPSISVATSPVHSRLAYCELGDAKAETATRTQDTSMDLVGATAFAFAALVLTLDL